jgi:hypothetical protein
MLKKTGKIRMKNACSKAHDRPNFLAHLPIERRSIRLCGVIAPVNLGAMVPQPQPGSSPQSSDESQPLAIANGG